MVAPLPRAYRTALHLWTCAGRLAELSRFFRWLDARGVTSLGQMDTECCEAYLWHRRYVLDLVNYRELFTADQPAANLIPWGGATPSAVAEMPNGRDENNTRPVEDGVLQPMLAAAPYLLTVFGPHAITLAEQLREADRLGARKSRDVRRAQGRKKARAQDPEPKITTLLAEHGETSDPLTLPPDHHVTERIAKGWTAPRSTAPALTLASAPSSKDGSRHCKTPTRFQTLASPRSCGSRQRSPSSGNGRPSQSRQSKNSPTSAARPWPGSPPSTRKSFGFASQGRQDVLEPRRTLSNLAVVALLIASGVRGVSGTSAVRGSACVPHLIPRTPLGSLPPAGGPIGPVSLSRPARKGSRIMRRYVLTGTPGAGKTSILRCLDELGYGVVEEAATAAIARAQALGEDQPWTRPSFIDEIVALQRQRQLDATGSIQVFDRSPVCTHALTTYLGWPVSPALAAELERITSKEVYERQVFFVRNLGFCEPTAARRISFQESLAFEKIHEESYRTFGYELIDVPASDLAYRVATVSSMIADALPQAPAR
ncbi:AAA family ATPase [Streptomyces sp. NPDC048277]|uniref:ATP/GTP-binding protein n=1 Tax=Streptomyces sp. NPDC048277 TaxID=3155027 RepID=UPI0033C25525